MCVLLCTLIIFSPQATKKVLYHYVQRLMAKDNLCHVGTAGDPARHFARIIRLYYLAMDHKQVNKTFPLPFIYIFNPSNLAFLAVLSNYYNVC
jgi:hypothetical protein